MVCIARELESVQATLGATGGYALHSRCGSDLAGGRPFGPADYLVKGMERFAIRPKIAGSKRFAFSGSLPGS